MLLEARSLTRAAAAFLVAAFVLLVVAFALAFGAKSFHVSREEIDAQIKALTPAEKSTTTTPDLGSAIADFTTIDRSMLALDHDRLRLDAEGFVVRLSQGFIAGSFILLVASGVFLRAARRALTAPPVGGLDAMHDSLSVVVAGIERAAVGMVNEAKAAQANVDSMEERLAELRALATVTEPQARAVSARLQESNRVMFWVTIVAAAVTVVGFIVQAFRG